MFKLTEVIKNKLLCYYYGCDEIISGKELKKRKIILCRVGFNFNMLDAQLCGFFYDLKNVKGNGNSVLFLKIEDDMKFYFCGKKIIVSKIITERIYQMYDSHFFNLDNYRERKLFINLVMDMNYIFDSTINKYITKNIYTRICSNDYKKLIYIFTKYHNYLFYSYLLKKNNIQFGKDFFFLIYLYFDNNEHYYNKLVNKNLSYYFF
jgi:hypothetical protein